MAKDFWAFNGIGIDITDIKDAIIPEKAMTQIETVFPRMKPELDKIRADEKLMENFNILDWCDNEEYHFDGLGELFTSCDDSNTIKYCHNEDGIYLCYWPSMPWELTPTDPKSLDECVANFVKAMQKITDLSADSIIENIDVDLSILLSTD